MDVYHKGANVMKRILLLIFALTILDAACTAAGLRLGAITEANPLMATMTAHPTLTGTAACVGTAALLLWLYSVRERVRWLGPALVGVSAVKLGVMGLHMHWILSL